MQALKTQAAEFAALAKGHRTRAKQLHMMHDAFSQMRPNPFTPQQMARMKSAAKRHNKLAAQYQKIALGLVGADKIQTSLRRITKGNKIPSTPAK